MNIQNILFVVLISFVMLTSGIEESGISIISSSNRFKILTVRRKRSLLLPKNSSLKLTVALGQALIATSPKGLSLSLEISDYYSSLTSLKDWLSEAPHLNVNKPKVKMSDNRDKTKNSYKYYKPFDSASSHLKEYINKPLDMEMSLRNKSYKYYNQYPGIVKHSQLNKQKLTSKWIDHSSQPIHKRSIEGMLSGLLGTNFKCVLYKSICTSKQFLLPPGYSMIHDIIRTMFLTPVHTARGEVESSLCENQAIYDMDLKSNYFFNFLDWILHPIKVDEIK